MSMTSPFLQRPDTGEEALFCATRALCNTCGTLTQAAILFRDGAVVLVKWCPEHGRTEALIASDQAYYLRSLAYIKPGQQPLEAFHAGSRPGTCPEACGLCPEHEQHTCVPILEITDRCNLACPICLVRGREHRELSVDETRAIVGHLVRYEGRLNMLTLSGGEPTLHPRFLDIVDEVCRPEIGIVSVSTNGLRLLENNGDLIRALRDRHVVIALQCDGFSAETNRLLRGRPDLGDIKLRIIERVLALGGRLSLTLTLARGVNEAELGPVLRWLFSEDKILSLMVQPLATLAAKPLPGLPDPSKPLTIPDVIRELCKHSDTMLQPRDFSPLPCSHPTCFALTYLLNAGEGRMVPLPRLIDPENYLDIIKNQALLGTDTDSLLGVRDALYSLWSSDGQIPDRQAVLSTIRLLLLELNMRLGSDDHRDILDLGTRHIKSIFIHQFMDRYTFDLSRAVKCCNHYPKPDGRLLPACIRNTLHLA